MYTYKKVYRRSYDAKLDKWFDDSVEIIDGRRQCTFTCTPLVRAAWNELTGWHVGRVREVYGNGYVTFDLETTGVDWGVRPENANVGDWVYNPATDNYDFWTGRNWISFTQFQLANAHLDGEVMARSVQIANHDAQHWDIWLAPETVLAQRRFNVLVPKTADREALCEVAHQLCTYVRLVVRPEPDVYFNRAMFTQAHYRLERALRAAERQAYVRDHAEAPRMQRPLYTMQPTAEQKARTLLQQLDPELCSKMEGNVAFYFATSQHVYIWYPMARNIVSLEPEGPKYVCIHSRDHTVEQNRYDWAITMRTYLLGDETHWRSKANFHTEIALRGGRDAHPDIVR